MGLKKIFVLFKEEASYVYSLLELIFTSFVWMKNAALVSESLEDVWKKRVKWLLW